MRWPTLNTSLASSEPLGEAYLLDSIHEGPDLTLLGQFISSQIMGYHKGATESF